MHLPARIAAFARLGDRLRALTADDKADLARRARAHNTWFDAPNVEAALAALGEMLQADALNHWLRSYPYIDGAPRKVGVVMAGNIPAVGFHDMLCVLVAGHELHAKLSKEDPFLIKWLTGQLEKIEPRFAGRTHFADLLKNMDMVIATGSDNTARYFEYYFRTIPHLIRQNRSSAAVLTGRETTEELRALGQDLFLYYGLGCRNVSKLYVPAGYNFSPLLDTLQPWERVLENNKYQNNYDYNKSILLVNREPHLDTGFVLLRESRQPVSPISVVHYEQYQSPEELEMMLAQHQAKTQCVVGAKAAAGATQAIGLAQNPGPDQYPDGVDTLAFLGVLC